MTAVAIGVWAQRTFVTDGQTDGFAVAIDDSLQSNVSQKQLHSLNSCLHGEKKHCVAYKFLVI
jgi:hypothetical protein